ncbi:hypothetical protein ACLOJK_021224 [Asimina triloba]
MPPSINSGDGRVSNLALIACDPHVHCVHVETPNINCILPRTVKGQLRNFHASVGAGAAVSRPVLTNLTCDIRPNLRAAPHVPHHTYMRINYVLLFACV